MADQAVSANLRRRNEREKELIDTAAKLTTAEQKRKISKEWRERLKENPAKYKEHRLVETLRLQDYRKNLSNEQKEIQKGQARLRQQRYRNKKKLEGHITSKAPVNKTRASKEVQRQTWREAKRLQRMNLSHQKKRRINERRRKIYHEKKQPKSSEKEKEIHPVDNESLMTQVAKRKAVSRCLRVLPKNPKKYAEVVTQLYRRKKQAFGLDATEKKKNTTTLIVKEKLMELRNRRKERDNRIRRIIHASLAAKGRISRATQKEFGLSKKLSKLSVDELENEGRKARSDCLPDDAVKEVTEFYQSSEMSRELPLQRLVSAKKMTEPRKALEQSLVQSYKTFKTKYPENKLSYSKFASLRPSNVLPLTKQKHYQCLCEYCVNVDFQVKALERYCCAKKLERPFVDRYDASRITLCPKDGANYKMECLDRNCQFCGVDNVDEKTRGLNQYIDTQIKWRSWEMVTQPNTQKKFMTLVSKEGTIGELITELKLKLNPFAKHLFNAKWQSGQFDDLKKKMPKQWAMFCMDFGENYACHHQDEAQGAHWHYEQVTMHPIVVYYRCQKEGCDETVHESLVFITDDHKHDYHAVQHFIEKSNQYLLEEVGLDIHTEIHFSDGAPTQYKSKFNFVDMSMGQDDFGLNIEKHYFGSRHGKGPCDGEVGVLKRSATSAVKRGEMISNAKDFFEYAKENLSLPKMTTDNSESHIHSKRIFFFVNSREISRDRQPRLQNIKAVPQTRQSHHFKSVQPFVVLSRERTCFCDACQQLEGSSECKNADIVGKWNVHTLKIRRRQVAPPAVDVPVNDAPVDGAPLNDAPVDGAPLNDTPVNDAPADGAPVDGAPENDTPMDGAPLNDAPVDDAPVNDAPADGAPVDGAPVDGAPLNDTHVDDAPVNDAPVNDASVDGAPVDGAPENDTPMDGAPLNDAPVDDAPVNDAPADGAPVDGAPVDGAPLNDTHVDDAPVNDAPVDDAPVNDASVDGAPVNDAPVDDAPVNDASVDGAPVNDAPVDDAPVNDAPVDGAPVDGAPENDIPMDGASLNDSPVDGVLVDGALLAVNTQIGDDSYDDAHDLSGLSIDTDAIMEEMNKSTSDFNISLDGMLSAIITENMPPTNAKPDPEGPFRCGQFVLVTLTNDRRKKPKQYVAEIKELHNGEALLQFMQSHQEFYFWPTVEDFSWEPLQNVVSIISPPVFVAEKSTTRRQLFKL
ncbi:uncharacterized protein LOC117338131 isoform X1 [Pecten maximus]|uniref:uncharacterized protein LOC117338131 isoform X1 n=1 Tax=Pecten maximus TaxID=6579 RepID=UPI001458C0E5|nr:uncharacterized protein LOC117338131 isoform X1 [Pecten maximus]